MVRRFVLSFVIALVCCPAFAATQQQAQDAGIAAAAAKDVADERRDESFAMEAQAVAKIAELENRISTLYNDLIAEGYQHQQAQDAVDAANTKLGLAEAAKEVGDSRHSTAAAAYLQGSDLYSAASNDYGNGNYTDAWNQWNEATAKFEAAKNGWYAWSGYYVSQECSHFKYNNARGHAQDGLDDIANLFP